MPNYTVREKARGSLVERRQHQRYIVSSGDFLVFRHEDNNVGWITDLSRGGLSYEYIPTSESKGEGGIIDIFVLGKKRFFLPSLNCKIVYSRNEKATSGSNSTVTFKRCGLKCVFSNKQAARLDEFLIYRLSGDGA